MDAKTQQLWYEYDALYQAAEREVLCTPQQLKAITTRYGELLDDPVISELNDTRSELRGDLCAAE